MPQMIRSDALLLRAMTAAMVHWHNKDPKAFQLHSGCCVLEIASSFLLHGPQPILLIRSTGGGKSAVRDCIGFCIRGVIITVVPLLSLAADQNAKMKNIIANMSLHHDVEAYNIDTIRSKDANHDIQAKLISAKRKGDTTFFLFTYSMIQP